MKKIMIAVCLVVSLCAIAWGNPLMEYSVSEFSTQPPWIEIHFNMQVDLSGLIIHTSASVAQIDSGIIGDPQSHPYVILDSSNTTGFTLNPDGDDFFIEGLYIMIHYGTKGPFAVAPLPNESAVTDDDDGSYFCFNANPNPGGPGDIVHPAWGQSPVIINDISINSDWNRCPGFVELYNRADTSFDISGYQIICNGRYSIAQETIIKPHHFYVLDECRYPAGFYPHASSDVLYLINREGALVDQVGWTSDHGINISLMRLPDGNVNPNVWRDFAGFDDTSSYTFEDGFPSRGAYNRYEDPGLKIIGIDADTSNSMVNLYWTNPIWLTIYDATIVRKSTEGFPATQYDGDLIYEGTDQAFWGDTAAPGQTTYYSIFARTGCGQYSIPDSESQISVYMPLSGINESPLIPERLGYLDCYPNPFNAKIMLAYQLFKPGNVKISIINLIGQEIALLYDNYQDAGVYRVVWDAAGCPSSLYFARLQSGDQSRTKKLVLLK